MSGEACFLKGVRSRLTLNHPGWESKVLSVACTMAAAPLVSLVLVKELCTLIRLSLKASIAGRS